MGRCPVHEFFRHLLNLLVRAAHAAVQSFGTTTLAVLVLGVLPFVVDTNPFRPGWWRRTRNRFGVRTMMAVASWTCIIAFHAVRIVYSDHLWFVSENARLRSHLQLSPPPNPPTIVVKDSAEVETLRGEVARLHSELDERQKLAAIRSTVGQLLTQGNGLKAACDSLTDKPELENQAIAWANQSLAALKKIDPSYAALFEQPSGQEYNRYVNNQAIPTDLNHVWNFVNLRTDVLARILQDVSQPIGR